MYRRFLFIVGTYVGTMYGCDGKQNFNGFENQDSHTRFSDVVSFFLSCKNLTA